jgi:hypothetical protein
LATHSATKFFNVESVGQLDSVQLLISYWIDLYESLNEMLTSDRPKQYIIENDYAFDEWLASWSKRNDKPTQHKPSNVWEA